MNSTSKTLATVAGSLFLLGAGAQAADKPAMEKCYGVAKAAKNDCGTASHACAGQAKKDGDPKEWLSLPKGVCQRLANGSLTAPK